MSLGTSQLRQRELEAHRDSETEREKDRETEQQRVKRTERQGDGETKRQRDRKTHPRTNIIRRMLDLSLEKFASLCRVWGLGFEV